MSLDRRYRSGVGKTHGHGAVTSMRAHLIARGLKDHWRWCAGGLAMPVKRIYTAAGVKAAIDLADNSQYRELLRVRDDVTTDSWGTARIRVERTASGNPIDPSAWRRGGSDAGRAFRHVAPSAPIGKSIHKNEATAVAVTRILLNSVRGQAALSALDHTHPTGDELGMDENRKIVARGAGVYYGAPGRGQPWKRSGRRSAVP